MEDGGGRGEVEKGLKAEFHARLLIKKNLHFFYFSQFFWFMKKPVPYPKLLFADLGKVPNLKIDHQEFQIRAHN